MLCFQSETPKKASPLVYIHVKHLDGLLVLMLGKAQLTRMEKIKSRGNLPVCPRGLQVQTGRQPSRGSRGPQVRGPACLSSASSFSSRKVLGKLLTLPGPRFPSLKNGKLISMRRGPPTLWFIYFYWNNTLGSFLLSHIIFPLGWWRTFLTAKCGEEVEYTWPWFFRILYLRSTRLLVDLLDPTCTSCCENSSTYIQIQTSRWTYFSHGGKKKQQQIKAIVILFCLIPHGFVS